MTDSLLEVRDLHVRFNTPRGVVRANNGINLGMNTGESLGIMGESGCGKTVLILSLMRLQQPGVIVGGSIWFDGREVTRLTQKEMQTVRGKGIALIPQNHSTALNPAYTVGEQLGETLGRRQGKTGLWQTLRAGTPGAGTRDYENLRHVLSGLGFNDESVLRRLLASYPHELSGGMGQRVLIAMALLLEPKLVIADEPTTALDRATRAETLELLGRLSADTTLMVVSHEVETLVCICNRVAVMYGGRVVESGVTGRVFSDPHHPYTRILLQSQHLIRGKPVSSAAVALDMVNFPPGCPFHPFCPEAVPACSREEPPETVFDSGSVACHLYNGSGTCSK
ncbi:MAG: ABC transporter ATP-binding protein [Dehalococcoidaceae bacterium]|nr:ABC transporter ATP-binding protein [Dehalococcoidaceae bacterium]